MDTAASGEATVKTVAPAAKTEDCKTQDKDNVSHVGEALKSMKPTRKEAEKRECTFTPKVSKKSREMNREGATGLARHHELHKKAIAQQKKLKEMREKQAIPKECTFKPRMSTANSRAARIAAEKVAGKDRYDRLYADSSQRKKKLEEARQRKSDAHSFKPQIDKKSKKIGDTSSFLERLKKTDEARKKRRAALKEEQERRLSSIATFEPATSSKSKKKKGANFDRLYRTGGMKERLRKAKEAQDEALKQMSFRPKVSSSSSRVSSTSRAPIHERLYKAASKSAARRKVLKEQREARVKKSCTFRPSLGRVGRPRDNDSKRTSVFERMEKQVKRERERKKRLEEQRLEKEIAELRSKPKISSSSSSTVSNGKKPIWERLHSRRNDNRSVESSLDREIKMHCRDRPSLSTDTQKLLQDRVGTTASGKSIWDRLSSSNRRDIEKKREAERLKREMAGVSQFRHATAGKKYKKNNESIFDRLHKRAVAANAEKSGKKSADDDAKSFVSRMAVKARRARNTTNTADQDSRAPPKVPTDDSASKAAAASVPPAVPSNAVAKASGDENGEDVEFEAF